MRRGEIPWVSFHELKIIPKNILVMLILLGDFRMRKTNLENPIIDFDIMKLNKNFNRVADLLKLY